MTDPKHEAANLFMGLSLAKLVDMNHDRSDQVNGNWRIEFNGARLQRKNFGGATTLDSNNHPVVYLSPRLNVEGLMFVIAHEAVHVAQICRGDYFPSFAFSIWKGREHVLLPADDPSYANQPWEAEAFELSPVLLEHLKSKVNPVLQDAT